MKHLDLFSGIGGFALAASWVWGAEHDIHSFVEIEPFCQKVLKKHWPDVPIHGDVTTYEHDGTAIDLLTGGFPCQPYSHAGKRGGAEDDRALWPYMLETIQSSDPTWIIGENVYGIVSMELDNVLLDLEASGYEAQSFVIPACAVGGIHRRDRVWILAHALCREYTLGRKFRGSGWEPKQVQGYMDGENETTPKLVGTFDGIPDGLDRIKSLGNAIVPQVVVPIMEAIKIIESKQQDIFP